MRKAFIKFLWGALISVFALIIIAFIAIWNGWVGYMPDIPARCGGKAAHFPF